MASGFDAAIARVQGIAERLEQPEPALERCAEAGADATRRGIEEQGLVSSGELLDSVYAAGAEFGASAPYAGPVNERRPFVPIEGGELTEPLASEVRGICESYVLEGGPE